MIVYIYNSNDEYSVEVHFSKRDALKAALIDIGGAFSIITSDIQESIDDLKKHGRFYHDGIDILIMKPEDKRNKSLA